MHSANLPGYPSIGIHKNHMDMTKFDSANDPGFSNIVSELRRWVLEMDVLPVSAKTAAKNTRDDHIARSYTPSAEVPSEHTQLASKHSEPTAKDEATPALPRDRLIPIGWNILHISVNDGNLDDVRRILEHGKDPNCATTKKGWTPLWIAACHGHVEIADLLLKFGAEVDVASEDGSTPLDQAALIGSTALVRKFLEHGASVEGGARPHRDTALIDAAAKGHIETVKLLLENGANCLAQQFGGWSPLHYALLRKQKEMAEVLLEACQVVTMATVTGITPLHLAAIAGFVDIVERLLDLGALADQPDNGGLTALRCAVSEGKLDVVRLLINMGARTDLRGEDGLSLHQVAMTRGHVDVSLFLEDRLGMAA